MTRVTQKEMTILCEPKYLHEVRAAVLEACQACDIPDRDARLIVLAVDEAVSSIVWHARDTHRQGDIHITIDINETRFKALIEDFSNGGDLNAMTGEELANYLERERKYQLGIFLIREIMDEVSYNYKKGFQNDLELVKFL